MKTHHEIISRPGVYHVMIERKPKTALARAWLDRTCDLVERFAASYADLDDDAIAAASMAIHCTADFLLECLETEAERQPPGWMDASFERLDPGAYVARLVRSSPDLVGGFAGVLRAFYSFLVSAAEIEQRRGQYLACYFETLLELHGAGPTGILPTRASRRATETLARRITEARIRSAERSRKKYAA